MKVLVIHNRYIELGGEDQIVDSEIELLKKHGHDVVLYERFNSEIFKFGPWRKIFFLLSEMRWSKKTYNDIRQLVKNIKPDIAHIHNIFYLITPAVYISLYKEGVPIVQTLHNYRWFCPNATFYRAGKICEKCFKNKYFFALRNRCLKQSFLYTLALVRVLKFIEHIVRIKKIIKVFVCLTDFSKNKFSYFGIPEKEIVVKPNFCFDLSKNENDFPKDKQKYAIFVGRLVDYKGVNTLVRANKKFPGIQLKIVGDGPLDCKLKKEVRRISYVQLLGRRPHETTLDMIRNASFLIFASECYENMPSVIIESFSCGTPVLATNIGAIKEIIQDGVNGLLFSVGDSEDLFRKIRYLSGNNELLSILGSNARETYKKRFTPELNYQSLLEIYGRAIETGNN
ncbi:MAG: glycosyltransferase family 4 protein [Candidatus Omnitrophica bacterium]|nr:glycosyltransferase family 4 protein [Candidatus Omnitrophota bacterium]